MCVCVWGVFLGGHIQNNRVSKELCFQEVIVGSPVGDGAWGSWGADAPPQALCTSGAVEVSFRFHGTFLDVYGCCLKISVVLLKPRSQHDGGGHQR